MVKKAHKYCVHLCTIYVEAFVLEAYILVCGKHKCSSSDLFVVK